MRILQVHNTYLKRGGEDTVVEEEKMLLEANGHDVLQYLKSNQELSNLSLTGKLRQLKWLADSPVTRRELSEIIERFKPDVCHVHNIFSVITPAVYRVCKEKSVPVVQTVHNYGLICTNNQLYRDNHICEECVGTSLYHSISKRCYKNSYLQTALRAHIVMSERNRGTFTQDIERFICLTEFARQKLVQGGVPADKIIVKPNFVKPSALDTAVGDYFIFIGRAENSKGIFDLLRVMQDLPETKLVVIGDCDTPEMFERLSNVRYLGTLPRGETLQWLANSRALIFPSRWYEGMPMVILEAFSLKKPVVARNLGAMSSILTDGHNGFHFAEVNKLVECIQRLSKETDLVERLGKNANADYERLYNPATAYSSLIEVYKSVLGSGT